MPAPVDALSDRIMGIVRRVPFTTTYVVTSLVVGVLLGVLWSSSCDQARFVDVAFGLPAFDAGRWLTLLWGPFFALDPALYLVSLGAFAVLAGFSEWRLGTARAAVIAISFHLATVLLSRRRAVNGGHRAMLARYDDHVAGGSTRSSVACSRA